MRIILSFGLLGRRVVFTKLAFPGRGRLAVSEDFCRLTKSRIVYASRFPPRPLAGQRLEAAGHQLEAEKALLEGSWELPGGSKSLPWRAPGGALEAPGAVLEALGDPGRHLGRPGGRP